MGACYVGFLRFELRAFRPSECSCPLKPSDSRKRTGFRDASLCIYTHLERTHSLKLMLPECWLPESHQWSDLEGTRSLLVARFRGEGQHWMYLATHARARPAPPPSPVTPLSRVRN